MEQFGSGSDENHRLMKMLNSITDGVHIVDANGKIIYANNAFFDLHSGPGCPISSGLPYVGESIYDVARRNDTSDVVSTKVLESGNPVKDKLVVYYLTGKNCILNGYPININGKLERVVVIVRDFSGISTLLQHAYLRLSREEQRGTAERGRQIDNLLGSNMGHIYEQVLQVAGYDVSLLLTGETGSGKDYLAKIIHNLSSRRGGFVQVNCGAIPEALLESELFGYEPGAFTGADKNGKAGLFEAANFGTLYLDEIGEMPLRLQVKLLAAIQNKQITRLGSTKPRQINVRVIAATNRDLEAMIRSKAFREDLYYRLNVVGIHIPPLRERPKDIVLLARQFLQEFNQTYGKHCRLSDSTMELLTAYQWPGNIRELKNVVERLVIFSDGLVQESFVSANLSAPERRLAERNSLYQDLVLNSEENNETLKDMVRDFEAHVIERAIQKSSSVTAAAAMLGLDVSTLRRKRKKQ